MLSNIFVPTDFSDCADNAVAAGIEFARRFKATLHLYHWLDMPIEWEEMSADQRDKFPGVQNYLTITAARFDEIITANKGVEIVYSISGGNFTGVIQNYQRVFPIDLIIMGSHGVSGMNEIMLGSITQRAIRKVHCPVLILKAPLFNIDFNKVIYASEFTKRDKESFLYFKALIKGFIPEIHLIALQPISFFSTPLVVYAEAMKDFARLGEPLNCITHQGLRLKGEKQLREFAKKIEADLIVISNHDRHPVRRLIAGSTVEYLVNHAEVPVLSIDYLEE